MRDSAATGDSGVGRLDAESHDEQPPRLALSGELDIATVPVAEQALRRHEGDNELVLDLRGLRFMDSSGLRVILSLAEAETPAVLHIIRGPDQVNRVFELTGAAERLNLVDDPSAIERA